MYILYVGDLWKDSSTGMVLLLACSARELSAPGSGRWFFCVEGVEIFVFLFCFFFSIGVGRDVISFTVHNLCETVIWALTAR